MKKAISLLLFTVWISYLFAADNISIQQFSIINGLESQTINAIKRDDLGRLWIASDVGISYISDGEIKNIKELSTDDSYVIIRNTKDIACYKNRLLIACRGRIITYDYDLDVASIIECDDRFPTTNCFLQEDNIVTFFDNDTQSLYTFDFETIECKRLVTFKKSAYSIDKILKSETNHDIIYLADNALGLFFYNLATGEEIRQVPGTDKSIIARATTIDNSNVLWLSVPSQGIKGYHINNNYELVAQYNTTNNNLPSNDVSHIITLPNGKLLTCHSHLGVNVITRERGRRNQSSSIFYSEIKFVTCSLYNANEDEVLFGTEGFGLIWARSTFIKQLRRFQEEKNGIIHAHQYISVYEEPQGTLLMGTLNNGMCRIDPVTQTETMISGSEKIIAKDICKFDDNNILVATTSNKLILIERNTGKITPLNSIEAFKDLPEKHMEDVLIERAPNGNIFFMNINSKHYVYQEEDKILREIRIELTDGSRINFVEKVCVTPYAIYATSMGSIIEINYNTLMNRVIYHNNNNNNNRVHYSITSLTSINNGNIFFTTPDGLYIYDPHSDNSEQLYSSWGNGSFMNATADNQNRIWFTTTDGYLHLYDYSKKELMLYTHADGVPNTRFLNNFSICTSSGLIIFTQADGLTIINSNGPLLYDTDPIQIIGIYAKTNKHTYDRHDMAKSLNKPIKLPAKNRNLSVEFSANSFNPIHQHLKVFTIYKEGKKVYSTTSSSSILSIPYLDYGTYTLTARPAYRRGLGDEQKILQFKVKMPFIVSLPGIIIIFISLILITSLVSLLTYRVEKNNSIKALAQQDIKNREDKIAFLSNMAHELRTPLSLIYNPVKDFLQEKSIDGIDYERMERIFNQVNKMTVMVNMILDSSRSDINKADIVVEEVNLNEWLDFLLEDYRIECYAHELKLQFVPDPNIGVVSIDKRAIETGLSNMVKNSIKYSPKNTVITVFTSHQDDMIQVSVKDQGRGFSCDPEELFKRYYRENEDSNIQGYGLGLPYARLMLSLVSGRINAMNNEDGIGSTFYMVFPRAIDNHGQPVGQDNITASTDQSYSADSQTEEMESVEFDTNKMTIMFVSSDETEQQYFKEEFTDLFKEIIIVDNSNNVIGILKNTPVDLVVSNVEINGTNGIKLCKNIKSTFEISHIPIILLTSRTDKRNRMIGYKMSADAYIPKPYDIKQLYQMAQRLLGGRIDIRRQYAMGYFSIVNADQTFSPADEEFINLLNMLIEESITNCDLTVDMLEDMLGYSHDTIKYKMEALIGTDLWGYLCRIRTELVKSLLANNNDTLEEIAKKAGFKSVNKMDKQFLRETGKSVFTERTEYKQ